MRRHAVGAVQHAPLVRPHAVEQEEKESGEKKQGTLVSGR